MYRPEARRLEAAAREWKAPLSFIFAVIVASFVAATAFTQYRMAAIDRAALDIAENASPSIDRLAVARDQMRGVQVLLREHVDRKVAGAPSDEQPVEALRRRMNESITDYLRLPVFPGEQDLWGDILRAEDALNEGVTRCLTQANGGDFQVADETLRTIVSTAADELGEAITRDVEFNAKNSSDLALRIRRLRDRWARWAFGLDIVCALITIGAAIVLRRVMRAHEGLVHDHSRLLEERASELEQFAGRVAHDILSPLSAVGLALDRASRSGDEEERHRSAARGRSALARVKRLVDGLLDFARAGAKPEPGARADVGSTRGDLLPELQLSATEARVELAVREKVTSAVACSPGILTSLISNLVRNALKYIGEGSIRRIEIRAFEEREFVRVEVQDSGPGLPADLEKHVFEPYLRGRHATQGGIGLGLATVKRLAEGHGGRVGVHSVLGAGCTFWFELPKARET